MTNIAIGLCRFSYFGRGDWPLTAGRDFNEIEPATLLQIKEELYNERRLEKRFWTFENLLLASIQAQTDQNFCLLVATSPELPEPYMQRLEKLCGLTENVELIVSEKPVASSAFEENLAMIDEYYGKKQIQFRIDDDDCLSIDYIEKLRSYAKRMNGINVWGYSRPRGIVAVNYSNENPEVFEQYLPFGSAGAALQLKRKVGTIFRLGHFSIGKKHPSILDNDGYGYLMTRSDGHTASQSKMMKRLVAIDDNKLATVLQKYFPFITKEKLKEMQIVLSS